MGAIDRLDAFLKWLRARNVFLGWFLTALLTPLLLSLSFITLFLPSIRYWLLEAREGVCMGYNRVWYVLLCGAVLLGLIPVLRFEYETIHLIFHRWSWMVLLSPSTYLFFGSMIQAFDLPLRGLNFIPTLFVPDESTNFYRRRYLWTIVVVIGIVVAEFVIQIIIWGTFPLEVDRQNSVRLRLIPFFPWPDRDFLTIQ
jgi:hypothetical protein